MSHLGWITVEPTYLLTVDWPDLCARPGCADNATCHEEMVTLTQGDRRWIFCDPDCARGFIALCAAAPAHEDDMIEHFG